MLWCKHVPVETALDEFVLAALCEYTKDPTDEKPRTIGNKSQHSIPKWLIDYYERAEGMLGRERALQGVVAHIDGLTDDPIAYAHAVAARVQDAKR